MSLFIIVLLVEYALTMGIMVSMTLSSNLIHCIFVPKSLFFWCFAPKSLFCVCFFFIVTIENSKVYSNTWWSSAAESAIVLAQSKSVDQHYGTKMLISGNVVYDNINKIP